MEGFESRVASFTKAEVIDALNNIDKEAYPDRYAILLRKLEEVKDEVEYSLVDPLERYHTGWRRFFAGVIDGLLVSLASVAILYLVAAAGGFGDSEGIETYIQPVYSIWMTWACGWTLGKRACGVKVVMFPDEAPVTFRAALIRDVFPASFPVLGICIWLLPDWLSLVSIALSFILALGIFTWFVLEIVTMLLDPRRRAFHDKIAGTVVVKTGGGLL